MGNTIDPKYYLKLKVGDIISSTYGTVDYIILERKVKNKWYVGLVIRVSGNGLKVGGIVKGIMPYKISWKKIGKANIKMAKVLYGRY